jgi:hypothetical protein
MSLEQNNLNKEEENKISLNKNDFIKQKNPKEADNPHQKKSETQYPSSAVSSIQNQDLIKTDSIKFIPEINNNANESSNKFNFFQSKKVISSEVKESDNNNNSTDKICCYCTKTRCIKKYCECFSNNRYCRNCHCVNCMNIPEYSGIELAKICTETDQVFCTCTKSNCNKKYCECYKSSQKCNDKCRCVNCRNAPQISFSVKIPEKIENINKENDANISVNNSNDNLYDNQKEKINLEDKAKNSKNNSRKSSSDSNDENDSYQIQRVSIYINKYQTVIDVEKFTKEMMSRKRKRPENNT